MPVLIDPVELAAMLAGAEPHPVVLDVRWSLAEPDGRAAYRSGHIPGAVYVDLEQELAGHGIPVDGRHPLPDAAAFTAAMQRWGIHDGDRVVVVDDLGNQSSARAWWLLRHAGIAEVRMLDGALGAWRAAGLPFETGDVVPEPGDAVARFGTLPVIDIDGAAAFPEHGVLLDARAGERYRGEMEPIDPRAGHIPGAVSAPTSANLDASGRFLPAAELRARFASLGVTDDVAVAAYCGSGITAAHEVAALAIAGFDAALFPGSWSAWANRSELPAATGPAPRE